MEAINALIGAASVGACATGRLFSSSFMRTPDGLQVVVEEANPEVESVFQISVLTSRAHNIYSIVFVHGLGGDRRETWVSDIKSKRVNGMTDLLPQDISHRARILSYTYSGRLFTDSKTGRWGQRPNPSRADDMVLQYLPQAIHLHSNRLLERLTVLRGDFARDRAIIWIGHSLGGLIVKNTLVQASTAVGAHSKHKAIQLSTCGILYFGTPMRGTKHWARVLIKMTSVSLQVPDHPNITKDKVGLECFDLQLQRYKSIESQFRNYSFCETKCTRWGSDGKGIYVIYHVQS